MNKKTITHLARRCKTACGKPINPETLTLPGTLWAGVDCEKCRCSVIWKEFAGEENPRNAGRRPIGIIKTNVKVTLYPEDAESFQALENKAEFIREAISRYLSDLEAKATADAMDGDAGCQT